MPAILNNVYLNSSSAKHSVTRNQTFSALSLNMSVTKWNKNLKCFFVSFGRVVLDNITFRGKKVRPGRL